MTTEMIRDEVTGKFLVTAFPKLNLSPCIFCGANTTLEASYSNTNWGTCEGVGPKSYWVQCSECGARGPELDQENAILEWEAIANGGGFLTKRAADEAVCSAKYHEVIASRGAVKCGNCGTPLHR